MHDSIAEEHPRAAGREPFRNHLGHVEKIPSEINVVSMSCRTGDNDLDRAERLKPHNQGASERCLQSACCLGSKSVRLLRGVLCIDLYDQGLKTRIAVQRCK